MRSTAYLAQRTWRMRRAQLLLSVLACPLLAAAAADDPAATLSTQQEQAVGLELTHPVQANAGEPVVGYGQVLDPVGLITDAGRLASTGAAARAAQAQTQRLQQLYRDQADASLKSVQTAEIAQIEAEAQAQAANANFAMQWGVLARMSVEPRRQLISAIAAGRTLLVRAEVAGRFSLALAPQQAVLDVDGVAVPARILGLLRRSASEVPSVSVLLRVDHAPSGLGPGARMPVSLRGEAHGGMLVPAGSLIYGEHGAYLYRQVAAQPAAGRHGYVPVNVKVLQNMGGNWLVEGVDADDVIVANGAGVLWSLQGISSFSAAEEEHD